MQEKKISFERIQSMPRLKKEIISYLFQKVSRKPNNEWWHFKGEFSYEGRHYDLECDCKCDNEMFTYRNLFIEHKQIVIDITDKTYDNDLKRIMH